MKAIKFFKFAVLATIVLFSACSKDDKTEPETQDNSDSAFFAAKVDDQPFPTANIEFTNAKFVNSTKMLQIIGQPEDRKETIVLTLMSMSGKVNTSSDWKPGTYDFDPIHVANLEYLASAEYNKWNGNGYDQWFTAWAHVKTGKITIESNTGSHIKGTFSFDAVRKNSDGSYNTGSIKKITKGSFDLDIK